MIRQQPVLNVWLILNEHNKKKMVFFVTLKAGWIGCTGATDGHVDIDASSVGCSSLN